MGMEEIRIADKDDSSYVKAALFRLDKNGEATITALGGRQNKLIGVGDRLEKINGIEVVSQSSIMVNGTPGLEIVVEKEVQE